MKCRKCGMDMTTTDSREGRGYTRRRKKCTSCGWKVSTREISVDRYKELLDLEKRFYRISEVVYDLNLKK